LNISPKITRRKFIKTSAAATAGLIIGCSVKNQFDIVIRNGLILDGLGKPAQKMDLGIAGDKITAIENLQTATSDVVIDATGLVVSPGFIDIHTHTDVELLVNPNAESKIHQGITTEVSGNCGYATFPLNDEDFKELDESVFEQYSVHVSWQDLPGLLNTLEKKKISFNYATFTGHGNLRGFVVGKNDVQPTPEQLQTMKKLLAESIENGSFGLSTGLEYTPGSYAKTEEIIELCKVVSEYNAVYSTHMRNEDDRVEEAVQEALQICRNSGASLQISHLKAGNQVNWHKVDNLLNMIHSASNEGLPVHADRYPYIAWSTGLTSLLPHWSRQGDTDDLLVRLSDKKILPEIREYTINKSRKIGGWDKYVINACVLEKNKMYEGKSIKECSELTGKEPFEFIKDLLVEERARVDIMGFAMSEENLKKVLSSHLMMVSSDASAKAPYGPLAQSKPHPRGYGTFPRVLGRYCRDKKLLELPTAVKKMTSMPAEKMGFKLRGQLKKGYFADIVVFNPETVADNATFLKPHQYPTGIDYVIVNGKITIREGKHTGKHAGQILRKV
jgi:N-acyl-D-amino-acid deacylase